MERYEASQQELEQIGAAGAEAIAEDLAEHVGDIRLLGRLKTGLITIQDICRLYGVAKRTVHNWPIEPVDTPTQRNYYRVTDIADQLVDE